ncbi:MAG: ABC transporter permease [Bacteroidales bacterium]|nr:ABC transporter permease [Bacteroidales bacterium]
MMRDFFRFALDSLSTNRRRVLLTVAIIAVGVASLVGIETAVGVLTDRVAGSFDRLGAGLFTIRPKEDASPLDARQAAAFAAAFRQAEAVSCWCISRQAAIVRSGGKATDPVVEIVATDAGYLACQDLSLASGRNFSPYEVEQHAKVALIGDNVRRRLFGDSDAIGKEITAAGARYRVIGVLQRQGALFGTGIDSGILCPMEATESSCSVTVRTAPAAAGATLSEAGCLMAAIRRLPPGAAPDFEIVQADSAQATLASLRAKLSLVALAIGLITMLGAAVGLMNSMLVSVKERTREIGTRRALGAKARAIARQFLGEALLIGLLGSAAGILLGLLLGNLVALALDGGFSIPWGWIAAAVLLASAVSLASGLLPARRAARLDPIEALRSL